MRDRRLISRGFTALRTFASALFGTLAWNANTPRRALSAWWKHRPSDNRNTSEPLDAAAAGHVKPSRQVTDENPDRTIHRNGDLRLRKMVGKPMAWKEATAGARPARADSANQAQRPSESTSLRDRLRLSGSRADIALQGLQPAQTSTRESDAQSSVPGGNRHEIILGLLAALRRKDAYTERHSVQVATYARCLAERLGAVPALREDICAAAALHDIGKIGIPDAILLKPAKLTRDEFEVIKLHPAMGETILEPAGPVRSIATLVLHHHEWHNGTGYPNGLRGADIPFGSKVIQAADCIDAMMSPRCYKRGFGLSRVIAELRSGRGIQFDPVVAEAAIAWLEDEPQCVVRTHFDARSPEATHAELRM